MSKKKQNKKIYININLLTTYCKIMFFFNVYLYEDGCHYFKLIKDGNGRIAE